MARFKIKFKWKSILCGILVIVTLIGACAGIAAIAKKDTKEIKASAFSRGDLDENGIYKPSETAIYTKESFGCIGLRVEPDFEFKGTYDVYYYDYTDKFVDSKLGLTSTYDEDYPLYIACNARIVIHPAVPEDVKEKDFKISFFEIDDYANDVTITVSKDQTYLYEDSIELYNDKNTTANKNFKPYPEALPSQFDSKNLTVEEAAEHPVKVTSEIAVDGTYNKYDVYVYLEVDEGRWPIVALFGADGKVLKDGNTFVYDYLNARAVEKPCWVKLTIEVPELESYDGVHLMAAIPDDSDCHIFGYND